MSALTEDEQRLANEATIRHAWAALVGNPHFEKVWTMDLQKQFNLHRPSFQGPDYNPHAAALKDGQKAVISHIARRLAGAEMLLELDGLPETKSTTAQAEFQGKAP